MGRDTRTRWPGVYARHKLACAKQRGPDARCTCKPSYYGVVNDRFTRKTAKTRFLPNVSAARNARADLADKIDRGERLLRVDLTLANAINEFVAAAHSGVALNKYGRRYKARAVEDLDGALNGHVAPHLGSRTRLWQVRRAHCQALVDLLAAKGYSGSRVRTIVNAIRSLYRWAQDRELVSECPASTIRLPAIQAAPRERVATPSEMKMLLAALPLKDAIPYALAAYAWARRAEILNLRWLDLSLDRRLLMLASDEQAARKSEAAHRVVPLLEPLRQLLIEHGAAVEPDPSALICIPIRRSQSGRLAPGALHRRCEQTWMSAGLRPIRLHECRHTGASWLDAAHISPKLASELMGHKTPARQPGAAEITLNRYTHTLPGDIERARVQLDAFLEGWDDETEGT